MEIKSIYRHFNFFTKEWIEDGCSIVEEKGDRCTIIVLKYFQNSPPVEVRKTVKKKSVKYYDNSNYTPTKETWKRWNYYD